MHLYGTFVISNDSTLIHYSIQIPHHRNSSFSPKAPLDCSFFSDFPCVQWSWQLWGVHISCFVQCPFPGVCLHFFSLMNPPGLRIWGGRPHGRMSLFLQYMKECTPSVIYYSWHQPWSSGWESICQVYPLQNSSLFYPFPCCALWKKISRHSPHISSGNYAPLFWEGKLSFWYLYFRRRRCLTRTHLLTRSVLSLN